MDGNKFGFDMTGRIILNYFYWNTGMLFCKNRTMNAFTPTYLEAVSKPSGE